MKIQSNKLIKNKIWDNIPYAIRKKVDGILLNGQRIRTHQNRKQNQKKINTSIQN